MADTDGLTEDTETPSLPEVFRVVLESTLVDVRVALPGRVVDYDPATRTATIQPLVGRYLQLQDETEVAEPLPLLVGVPVKFPGGGGFEIVWPLERDDPGELVFHDSGLDEWKAAGNRDVIASAVRFHHLSDATFEPGLCSPSAVRVVQPQGAMALGVLDGMSIHISKTGIALGEPTPAYAVALAEKVKAELQALRNTVNAHITAYNGHTHYVETAGSSSAQVGTTVATAAQSNLPAAVQDMGSATVKVKG